ncbi:MAG: right-handed parallel beta-helix repeat-containing protein [bacterium]
MGYFPLYLVFLGFSTVTLAATLEVGTARSFIRIEDALSKARQGDVISVYPGDYQKTALLVKTPNLHLKAAAGKVTLDGTGFNYSGKGAIPRAIIQFEASASDSTLEGFVLVNASNESFNGAGVRINQANNITIRNCVIQKNEMGIMSNGSVKGNTATNQLIEGCLISDNGTQKQAGYNHNLYLGGTSVMIRKCEVARSVTGHNIKSRAHITRVEDCYVHDSANREFDLVDGAGNTDVPASDAFLVANKIVKSPSCSGNRSVIHFGKDGDARHDGTLYLMRNQIVSPYVSPVVDVSDGNGVHFHDNTIDGANLTLYNMRGPNAKASGSGNTFPAKFTSALLPCAEQHGLSKEAK